MAQHDQHDDDHGEHHAHALPYDEAKVTHEITADREWMFEKFISWSAWTLVLIFLILALLALTQT